jgi:hypothetical protein
MTLSDSRRNLRTGDSRVGLPRASLRTSLPDLCQARGKPTPLTQKQPYSQESLKAI